MASKPKPYTGEATTANYGWTKPTVDSSIDAWGGYINTDLDGIDSVVHGIDSTYATKTYVDAKPVAIGDNRIINGDMRIDQRNNGASGTAIGVYTVDRWACAGNQAGKGAWQRNSSGPAGFGYCLAFTSTSAYAALAGDTFGFRQPIEADMIMDFAWGTAAAQPVTLSFWVFSSLTGSFGGGLRMLPTVNRSYPFTYSIPTANSWTKIVITIPGDTTGAWALTGNAAGLDVWFDLGSGSTFRGPANAWASASYVTATGAVSVVGTNSASFALTGVKLEIGSVATPFNRQSLAKSMADCQRYYQQLGSTMCNGYASTGAITFTQLLLPVAMRAGPTVIYGASPSYANASLLSSNNIDALSLRMQITITATGTGYGIAPSIALTAEL